MGLKNSTRTSAQAARLALFLEVISRIASWTIRVRISRETAKAHHYTKSKPEPKLTNGLMEGEWNCNFALHAQVRGNGDANAWVDVYMFANTRAKKPQQPSSPAPD